MLQAPQPLCVGHGAGGSHTPGSVCWPAMRTHPRGAGNQGGVGGERVPSSCLLQKGPHPSWRHPKGFLEEVTHGQDPGEGLPAGGAGGRGPRRPGFILRLPLGTTAVGLWGTSGMLPQCQAPLPGALMFLRSLGCCEQGHSQRWGAIARVSLGHERRMLGWLCQPTAHVHTHAHTCDSPHTRSHTRARLSVC